MGSYPEEIFDKIFALACTDSGKTGRALSLVSTRIHRISSPYKYYSLHITGSKDIFNFSAFLKTFLSPVSVQYLRLDYSQVDDILEDQDDLNTSVKTILTSLAAGLKGLYFIPNTAPLDLSSFTFPLLDTFYLSDDHHNIQVRWTSINCPKLKRLNFICDVNADRFIQWPLDQRTIFCLLNFPPLTHLGCYAHQKDLLFLFLMAGDIIGRVVQAKQISFSEMQRRLEDDWLQHYGIPAIGHPSTIFSYPISRVKVLMVTVPPQDIPALHRCIEGIGLSDDFQKNFPTVLGREPVGNSRLMEEWQYVVDGGEGFLFD